MLTDQGERITLSSIAANVIPLFMNTLFNNISAMFIKRLLPVELLIFVYLSVNTHIILVDKSSVYILCNSPMKISTSLAIKRANKLLTLAMP